LGGVLFFLLRLFKKTEAVHRHISGVVITESRWILGGVSLGLFVFVGARGLSNQQRMMLVKHELGHTRQSMLLGPLYLLLVGLPSLLWAIMKSLGFFKKRPYSWLYTEKWADRLADKIEENHKS
jgi:hypothetical protein